MRGLTASSHWTHLIPGFIVAGIGVGLVNPPLASTAVGVVQPQRAGMASGINSTFRQVGIATGIALLGTLFANRTHSVVTSQLASVPGTQSHTQQVATGLQSGELGKVLASLPAGIRSQAALATRTAFVDGLNLIFLVAAIIAIVAGVIALFAVRQKDFVQHGAESGSVPSASDREADELPANRHLTKEPT
jgi:hypothetical protein